MELNWTLDKLGPLLGGSLHGEAKLAFSRLAFDSRTLSPSDDLLFIALPGEQHDGHHYLADLYRMGVRCFLVSALPDISGFPEAGFCLVENSLRALQKLARGHRKEFQGELVAITGSNGKTIVKEWIYLCLGRWRRIHRSPKSYNSQLGVPLSLWGIDASHEMALIEAGISRPGEMARLQKMIQPDTGIFTHLGTAHQEHFPSQEAKLKEKFLLFSECRKVICRKDVYVAGKALTDYLQEVKTRIVDWSLEGDASYSYRLLDRGQAHFDLELNVEQKKWSFRIPFGDEASLENALHVVTFCLDSGMDPGELFSSIAELEPVSMRLEMLQGSLGSILINDSYNADTAGLEAALDLVARQDRQKRRIVILSDLYQSGRAEPDLYRETARMLEDKGSDLFIGIGPALMRQRRLFPSSSLFFRDTEEYLRRIDRTLFKEAIVLIKGSRSFRFEKISEDLQLKTHQTRLEIDLDAMVHNLNYYRSRLDPPVRCMIMVKALGYGSGSVEIASLLQFQKVDYLAVAIIDEGLELRKSGISLPIMVLNPDPAAFGLMLDYQLEPELFSLKGMEVLDQLLQERALRKYPVHLKMDTGMHRMGFGAEDLPFVLRYLDGEHFRVSSVFSHLAAAGDPEHDDFTHLQIERFRQMCQEIEARLPYRPLRHILNTSGIERFPEAQFDMVRLGIGLHGIGKDAALRPVSTLKTVVSQLRQVAKGETIGYSRRGQLDRDSLIATVPVGYADGLLRSLGNGNGKLYVHGKRVPIVGDICMDMCMIDVTGVDLKEGDEVEIFGRHQPVRELAEQAGTIGYEILTSVPERVKRLYLQE